MSLPYSLRTLYLHSLTSLLWNHTATYRLHHYGNKPVQGDLVLKESIHRDQVKIGLSNREWVHVLSSEDVQNHKYSLKDVVLPVVGTNTIFPQNTVAER